MKQPTPDMLRLSAGETLRFALGSADGPRSNIWTVFGSKNTDDIYVGARDTLPMAKPIADGWVHAVSIAIPSSSIQTEPGPLKRPKKGTISFYEIEPDSRQVRFDVLIKSAGASELRIENIHAQVGRVQLPGGGCVWAFTTELVAVDDRAEADVENLRILSRNQYIEGMGLEEFRQYERPVGAGWGSSNDDGRPVIIDLGDLRIAEGRGL